MTPPAVADGSWSALRAGSSATSISTMATIQASFANAAEFFNSLLVGRELIPDAAERWMLPVVDLDPATRLAAAVAALAVLLMGNSERRRQDVAGNCEDAAPAMVGGAHLPAEGDGRLHRGQSRVRELLADFIGT